VLLTLRTLLLLFFAYHIYLSNKLVIECLKLNSGLFQVRPNWLGEEFGFCFSFGGQSSFIIMVLINTLDQSFSTGGPCQIFAGPKNVY
jgi:hypothetical protein